MKGKVLNLAIKSIKYRKLSVLLSIISIALSVALLLGIQRVVTSLEDSFSSTISGTDLIVGAPTGDISLLLATVFHKGSVNQGISWETYERIKSYPEIQWSIPIVLGDSHKGYTVIGTTTDIFSHYKYGSGTPLSMSKGQFDISGMNCVIGSKVAQNIGYTINDPVIITHGMGREDFSTHGENPFRISAILIPTGTPIDNAIIVSIESLEHIHEHFYHTGEDDYDFLGLKDKQEMTDKHLHPETITGFYLGLKLKSDIPKVQRLINEEKKEPLLAIMPVVTLLELWAIIKPIERGLMIISVIVLIVSLGSVLINIVSALNQRRREMAILRSLGARPNHIFGLIIVESIGMVSFGIFLGILILVLALSIAQPILARSFGIIINMLHFDINDLIILLTVAFSGIVIGLLPAIKAYKQTLADGLTIKL